MNLDIRSYVKIYPNLVDESLCKEVLNELSAAKWEKHSFYNARQETVTTYDTDFLVTRTNISNTENLHKCIWNVLEQYILKELNYDWLNGWSGFSPVRYNKYEVGTEMRLHCDHINSIFDGTRKGIPTFSVLGALNDDYEGGDLIMWGDEKIELKAGSIMVFPSNFMYPHKVTPVTKGTRYSYVSWVW